MTLIEEEKEMKHTVEQEADGSKKAVTKISSWSEQGSGVFKSTNKKVEREPPEVEWAWALEWTPTWKNKAQEKRALKYFKKCEQDKLGQAFQDFKNKVLHFIVNRRHGQPFTHTFVEYVILEVTARKLVGYPTRLQAWYCRGLSYSIIRSECLFRWGRSPRLYAKVYYDLISNAMKIAWKTPRLAYRYFLVPGERRKENVQLGYC